MEAILGWVTRRQFGQAPQPFVLQPQFNQNATENIAISEVEAGKYQITVTNWSQTESELEGAVALYAKDGAGTIIPVTLSGSLDFTQDQNVTTTYSATVDASSSLTGDAAKIGAFIDANGNSQLDTGTLVKAKLTLASPDFNSDLVISFDHQSTSNDTNDDFVFTYNAPTVAAALAGNILTLTVSNVSSAPQRLKRCRLAALMMETVCHCLLT